MESINKIFLNGLMQGCVRLSPASRKAIAAYIKSQEVETGGFRNKIGDADLYYTFFGLMCALLLGVKVRIKQHRNFLKQFDIKQLDLPHFVAYVQTARLLFAFLVPAFLHRRGVGLVSSFIPLGVAHDLNRLMNDNKRVPMNDPCSPYSVFLAKIAVGMEKSDIQWYREQMSGYQTTSGGWSNIRGGTSPSLNATVSGMMILWQMKQAVPLRTIEWLKAQQHPSGGFMAVPDAPVPDLLSTSTALLALNTYNNTSCYPVKEFIQAHWRDNGGFAGTFADETTDCEYTLYGLLALGMSKK